MFALNVYSNLLFYSWYWCNVQANINHLEVFADDIQRIEKYDQNLVFNILMTQRLLCSTTT